MTSIKQLDTGLVEKKFSSAKATQDSIQGVALWMLAHKAQCDQIVATWLKVLRTSKSERRLTLFYICNEIVQTCRKKHAIIYKDAFKEVLRDAAILVRDKNISPNIERIFKIWEERGIYEQNFVQELLNLLSGVAVHTSTSKLLSEFNPKGLRESITNFVELERELESKRKKLMSVNVELSSKQIAKLFKDRNQGKQYSQQIEESHENLTEFVAKMEKVVADRLSLIDKLECGLLFYEAQYGEARIVTNAYRNFGNRIKNLQKKLEEHQKILPTPPSPIPSPPVDAPSPVDSLNEENCKDNMETVDMDLSDEDTGATGGEPYADTHVSFGSYLPVEDTLSSISMPALQSPCANMRSSMMFRPPNNFMGFSQSFGNADALNISETSTVTSSMLTAFHQPSSLNSMFLTNFQSPPPMHLNNACSTPLCVPPAFSPTFITSGSTSTTVTFNQPSVNNKMTSPNMGHLSHGLEHSNMAPLQKTFNNLTFMTTSASYTQETSTVQNNSQDLMSEQDHSNKQLDISSSGVPVHNFIQNAGTSFIDSSVHEQIPCMTSSSYAFSDMITNQSATDNEIENFSEESENIKPFHESYEDTSTHEALDPFSLLNKLLEQNKKTEPTSSISSVAFLDLLTKGVKSVKPNNAEEITLLSSGSSTPVLDRRKNSNFADTQSGHELIQELETASNVDDQLQQSVTAEESYVTNLNPDDSKISPSIESNILSKVSSLKPDVFEVLKNIIDSTKKLPPVDNSSNLQTTEVNNSQSNFDSDKVLSPSQSYQNYNDEFYSSSDVLPREEHSDAYLDPQEQYYPDEDCRDQSFESQDEIRAEERSISPPKVPPPKGPLIAPKCFLEHYTHVIGNNIFPMSHDMEFEDDMNHSMELSDDSVLLGSFEDRLDSFDDGHHFEGNSAPNFTPGNFEENLHCDSNPYDDRAQDFSAPPEHFNSPHSFGTTNPDNFYNRNVGFHVQSEGFFDCPPLRFQPSRFSGPRYFGRGRFPR